VAMNDARRAIHLTTWSMSPLVLNTTKHARCLADASIAAKQN
jgi:hypothetical protein